MRRALLAVVLALFVAGAAPALAKGPSGSDEDGNGNLTCADGTAVPGVPGGMKVYQKGTALETCQDGASKAGAPVDGRVLVVVDQGSPNNSYVAQDGSKTDKTCVDAAGRCAAGGYTRVGADPSKKGGVVEVCNVANTQGDATTNSCSGDGQKPTQLP